MQFLCMVWTAAWHRGFFRTWKRAQRSVSLGLASVEGGARPFCLFFWVCYGSVWLILYPDNGGEMRVSVMKLKSHCWLQGRRQVGGGALVHLGLRHQATETGGCLRDLGTPRARRAQLLNLSCLPLFFLFFPSFAIVTSYAVALFLPIPTVVGLMLPCLPLLQGQGVCNGQYSRLAVFNPEGLSIKVTIAILLGSWGTILKYFLYKMKLFCST